MGIRVDWGVFMAHSRVARHIKSNFPGPNDDGDATPVANCDSMAVPVAASARRRRDVDFELKIASAASKI